MAVPLGSVTEIGTWFVSDCVELSDWRKCPVLPVSAMVVTCFAVLYVEEVLERVGDMVGGPRKAAKSGKVLSKLLFVTSFFGSPRSQLSAVEVSRSFLTGLTNVGRSFR
jgi:hypothetical protein